jgi:hypothetical protein
VRKEQDMQKTLDNFLVVCVRKLLKGIQFIVHHARSGSYKKGNGVVGRLKVPDEFKCSKCLGVSKTEHVA